MEIKTVAVLGANGTMGRNIAAIFASFGKAKVFLATRSLDKSKFALEKAYQSVRCESIKERMVPVTYDDIQNFIPECNLVFESFSDYPSLIYLSTAPTIWCIYSCGGR